MCGCGVQVHEGRLLEALIRRFEGQQSASQVLQLLKSPPETDEVRFCWAASSVR